MNTIIKVVVVTPQQCKIKFLHEGRVLLSYGRTRKVAEANLLKLVNRKH